MPTIIQTLKIARRSVLVMCAGGLAVAGVAFLAASRSARPRGLSGAEQVRATTFLAGLPTPARRCVADDVMIAPRALPCAFDDHADVDGDGRADCWRAELGNADTRSADQETSQLTVWPGCRGTGLVLEVRHEGTSLLVIPDPLATSAWLSWLAQRIVGPSAVECADRRIVGCPGPGPEWAWILASADRRRAEPGWHGTVAPSWQADRTPSTTTAGALIVPHVPRGWMARYRGGEEAPPPDAPEGARIVVDAGSPPRAPPIACANLEIRSGRRGITAGDPAHHRWTWLFRGLPDYGGFDAKNLVCLDDVVIATTGGPFAQVAMLDPASGGWLFASSYDAGPGAELRATPDGNALWRDEYNHLIAVRALHGWLATPAARREPLEQLAASARPELADARTEAAQHVARDLARREELSTELFPAATLDAAIRRSLAPHGTCAGWRVSTSPTALLVERDGQARWVEVEPLDSTRRTTGVACRAGRLIVTCAEVRGDLLEPEQGPETRTTTFEIDLVAGWWQRRRELCCPDATHHAGGVRNPLAPGMQDQGAKPDRRGGDREHP